MGIYFLLFCQKSGVNPQLVDQIFGTVLLCLNVVAVIHIV